MSTLRTADFVFSFHLTVGMKISNIMILDLISFDLFNEDRPIALL